MTLAVATHEYGATMTRSPGAMLRPSRATRSAAVQLLTDQARADAIGDEAARTVRARAGWDRAAHEFDKICGRVLARGPETAEAGVHP